MTVNTTESGPFNYAGNGATTSFPFNGKIQNENQVGVTLTDADGNVTVQVLNTDYTVQNISESGADVVMTVAPPDQNTLSLFYDIDATQLTDYIEGGKFPAQSHEDALDKLTLLVKQIEGANKSNISMPPNFVGDAPDFPLPESNNVIGWNQAADALINIPPEQIADIEFGSNNFIVDKFVDGVDYTAGTSTQITLSGNPGSENNTQITFDGLMQHKSTYSISGAVVTFDAAIPNGVATIECMRAAVLGIGVPADGTVSTIKIVDDAVTTDKIAPVVATGSTTGRRIEDRFADVVNVLDFGAVGDGVTDDTAAIQAALSIASDGDVVSLPKGRYYCTSSLTLPNGCVIKGPSAAQGTSGDGGNNEQTQLSRQCTIISTASTVLVAKAGSRVDGLQLIRSGVTFEETDESNFSGTGITISGDDVMITNCSVYGFSTGISSFDNQRSRIIDVVGDCVNGIFLQRVLDISTIERCHFWPYCTVASGPSYAHRTGTAYKLQDVADWCRITDSFCFGYQVGIHLQNVSQCRVVGCGVDHLDSIAQPKTGIRVDSPGADNTSDNLIANCVISGKQDTGIVVEIPSGECVTVEGCQLFKMDGATTTGINVISGSAIIKGNSFAGTGTSLVGVNAAAGMATYGTAVINNFFRMSGASSVAIQNQGGERTIHVRDNMHYGTPTLFSAPSADSPAIISPSANVLTLPPIPTGRRAYAVSDSVSNTFNSISDKNAIPGDTVTLIFNNAITAASGPSVLLSSTPFAASANQTLTLLYKGGGLFVETSRS